MRTVIPRLLALVVARGRVQRRRSCLDAVAFGWHAFAALLIAAVATAAVASPHIDHDDRYRPPGVGTPLYPAPRNPVPPPPPDSPQWEDADQMAFMMADGAYTLCQAAVSPLSLIPAVGPPSFLIAEWACILPAAILVDNVAMHHGGRDPLLWEAAVSLGAAKAFRDIARVPQVSALLLSSGATGIVTVAAVLTSGLRATDFEVSAEYRPIALAGTLTSTALLTVVLEAVVDVVAQYIFQLGYQGLTTKADTPQEAQTFSQDAYLPQDRTLPTRFGLLAATAAGSKPDFNLLHYIPMVGRFVQAYDSADALKGRMRRLSTDSLGDEREAFWPMDATIYATFTFDAVVGALADFSIVSGAAVFVIGSTLFVLERSGYAPAQEVTDQGIATLGAVGVFFASTALILLTVRDVRQVAGPLAVAIAYGPLPDDTLPDIVPDVPDIPDAPDVIDVPDVPKIDELPELLSPSENRDKEAEPE